MPAWADEHVRAHAGNFLWTVKETLRGAPHHGGKLPAVIAPFDAELFGHWWFEGPEFLGAVLRELDLRQGGLQAATAAEAIGVNPHAWTLSKERPDRVPHSVS